MKQAVSWSQSKSISEDANAERKSIRAGLCDNVMAKLATMQEGTPSLLGDEDDDMATVCMCRNPFSWDRKDKGCFMGALKELTQLRSLPQKIRWEGTECVSSPAKKGPLKKAVPKSWPCFWRSSSK